MATSRRQLLSVAPMMDWTDVHYRQLARIISKHTWLWTEMVVDKTILHTPYLDKFLSFPIEQSPIVLQIGGSDPSTLAQACERAKAYGYDEVNLNCGCPSDRVAGAGCFGASLMKEPELVSRCMKAMSDALGGTPVTVKCRLGVDEIDSYSQLKDFVSIVSQGSPTTHFVIHARKCFLNGLNPSQNRTVPPLRHEWVYSLKRDFPHLLFSLNGGVQSAHEARALIEYEGLFPSPGFVAPQDLDEEKDAKHSSDEDQCKGEEEGADPSSTEQPGPSSEEQRELSYMPHVQGGLIEGVMIGRAAYNDPWGCLGDADRALFGEANASTSRRHVLKTYTQYADAVIGTYGTRSDGQPDPNVRALVKPLLGMFYGEAGSKKWKNAVDTVLRANPPSLSFLLDATLHHIPDAVLDAPPKARNISPKVVSLGPMASEEDRAGGGKTIGELKRLVVTRTGKKA